MGKQQRLKAERNELDRRLPVLREANIRIPDIPEAPTFVLAASAFLETLQTERTPENLLKAVGDVLKTLDSALGKLPNRATFSGLGKLSIACRPGCDHCCTTGVSTWPPVVLAVAAYLRRKLTDEQLAEVRARVDAYVAEGASLSLRARTFSRRMCPLNENGNCRVYDVRPLPCRTYHSFNVDRCRADREAASEWVSVPYDPERLHWESVIDEAAGSATEALGLSNDEVDFIPALQIALAEPDAAERYLAGDPVFARAISDPDEPDFQSRPGLTPIGAKY